MEDQKLTFNDMGLDPRCLSVLEAQGLSTPTPIQEQAIPVVMTGRDLIATAQTGSGKTLAYTLPSMSRLAQAPDGRNRMLVLAPTRELAHQVHNVAHEFVRALHMKSAIIYGGVGFQPQVDALHAGADLIVATPGRLLDHMGRGRIDWSRLEVLVLDEADRMLDMGFLPDIQRIIAKLPRERQTLMFSATFAPELDRLAERMMNDAERIVVGTIAKPVETVRQLVVPVAPEGKMRMLFDTLDSEHIDSAIIFLRTKQRTQRVGENLQKAGYKCALIHGDLSQKLRQEALDGFRSGEYQFLAATDVAARGLDVDSVSHVINYDIPENPDDYIHRIGRTARAAREGDAITFVSPNEAAELEAIERALGRSLPRKEYEGAPLVLSLWKPPGYKPPREKRVGAVVRKRRTYSGKYR